MRRLAWLFAVVVLAVIPAFPQSYPEVDALVEAFYAKDVDTVAKHLPVALQKALSELPPRDRATIGRKFLLSENMRQEGGKLTRAEDGRALAVIEEPQGDNRENRTIEVVLDKRISDGYESLLRLKLKREPDPEHRDFALEVWMRYVEGEWRVYEIEYRFGEQINLEDPQLLAQLRGGVADANEASAVGTLRTYNTALVSYRVTYPNAVYPSTFEALGGDGSEPSSSHSALVDRTLSSPPYEKSGYRFTYRLINSGSENAAYTIVARPMDFGNTGKRSFFTDESTIIHFTDEDRDPTKEDPALR